MSQGVLYIAVGEQYISETVESVNSVRAHMPEVQTAIATDNTDAVPDVFDHVIELNNTRRETIEGRSWLINSTIPSGLSPFNKTLYLDSDTHVCEDVSEVFTLLDNYDLAICRHMNQTPVDSLPKPWHLFNCGVIAYTDSHKTRRLLDDWQTRYKNSLSEQDIPVDQPAFAESLYHSDIRWFQLPIEYNVRFPRRGALAADPKIVHGRHPAGLKQIASELSSGNGLRVFREKSYKSSPVAVVKDHPTPRYLLEKAYHEDGALTTVKKAIAWGSDLTLRTNLYDRWFSKQ